MYLFVTLVQAQDTTHVDVVDLHRTNRVQWIDQIPPLKEDIKNPNRGWLKKLLLGDKEITSFQKPIHVIGSGHESAIVLDQEAAPYFMLKIKNLPSQKA